MNKLLLMLRNKKAQVVTVVTAGMVSFQSNAAIDVSAAVTAITTDGTAAITAIGGALIALAATAVVFKWAKGAIFG
jgi:uncharacterized membrane protein (DUF373 family)